MESLNAMHNHFSIPGRHCINEKLTFHKSVKLPDDTQLYMLNVYIVVSNVILTFYTTLSPPFPTKNTMLLSAMLSITDNITILKLELK
jgi:hypothetical protein